MQSALIKPLHNLFFLFKIIILYAVVFLLSGCGGSSSSPSAMTEESCTSTSGICYWVDSKNGSDANSGKSSTTPWSSLANFSSTTLAAGDKILIKNGSTIYGSLTVSASGTSSNPIIITNYGTSESNILPVIRGSEKIFSNWTQVTGTSVYYISLSTWSNVPGVVLYNNQPMDYVAWNTDISTTISSLLPGRYTSDSANKKIYLQTSDSKKPTSSEISVGKELYGIKIDGKSYIQISNLTIEQFALHGIYVNDSSNIILDGLTIKNGGGSNISTSTAGGNGVEFSGTGSGNTLKNSSVYQIFDSCVSPQQYSSSKNLTSTTIQGNTFYNCGFNAVEVSIHGLSSGGSNTSTYINGVTIKDNTIYDIGKGWSGDREGSAIKIFNNDGSATSTVTNVTIESNSIYNNSDHGIYLQSYTGSVSVLKNAIRSNSKSGVFVEDSITSTSTGINLYYNIIYSNQQHGFKYNVPSGQGFTVYNNTFVSNGQTASTQFNVYFHSASGTKIMKNNICYSTGTLCLYDNPGTIVSGSGFNYNLFYASNSALDLFLIGSNSYNISSTLAAFKSATNSNSNSVFSDPTFVDLSSNNFRLQSGSAAGNAGVVVGLTSDYAGATVSTSPDIGAFESL